MTLTRQRRAEIRAEIHARALRAGAPEVYTLNGIVRIIDDLDALEARHARLVAATRTAMAKLERVPDSRAWNILDTALREEP